MKMPSKTTQTNSFEPSAPKFSPSDLTPKYHLGQKIYFLPADKSEILCGEIITITGKQGENQPLWSYIVNVPSSIAIKKHRRSVAENYRGSLRTYHNPDVQQRQEETMYPYELASQSMFTELDSVAEEYENKIREQIATNEKNLLNELNKELSKFVQ